MCGRTVCHLAPCDIQSACTYKDKNGKTQKPDWRDATNGKNYHPSYNIAPGAHTPILLSSRHFDTSGNATSRVIQPMLWGLIPSWHKGSVGNKAFETNNCRAETMMEKQTYKVPLQKGRRCVILAEGFYEWKRDKLKSTKQPYYIYFPKKSTTDVKIKSEKLNDSTTCDERLQGSECDIGQSQHVNGDIKEDESVKVKVELSEELSVNIKMEGKTEKANGNGQSLGDTSVNGDIKEDENIKVKVELSEELAVDIKMEEDETGSPLIFMAGVFDVWQPEDGSEKVYSYSVITVESSPAMAWLHHRMPAVLSTDEEIDEWLNFGEFPISKAVKLIQPSLNIELYPVSTFVNNSRNNSPDCVKKIDPSKPNRSASSNMMMSWLSKDPSPAKTEPISADRKTNTKRKAGSNMMMSWLTKGNSPGKSEAPDKKKMKPS